YGISIATTTRSLQYVYSGTSGIPNLPEFMTVGLVDGEPFTYYDSKIRKEVPRQDWVTKAVEQGVTQDGAPTHHRAGSNPGRGTNPTQSRE
uniref:MHC class I-like antigen recognition-like domain-containing protein n=1 Tax=Paramormyrops kingsleyae TaxID=1676925 RepID=A0A3B3Q6C2_9TELE